MATTAQRKSLFIPLKKREFDAFVRGAKSTEYRCLGRQFSLETVYPGRLVTLSCGYSGARLHGTVHDVDLMYAAPGCGLDTYGPGAEIIAITISLHSHVPTAPARRALGFPKTGNP